MQNNSRIRAIEKMFWVKRERFDSLGKPVPKERTNHRNTFLGGLSENPRFSG